MMQRVKRNVQEDLLNLLVYDVERGPIIRNLVPLECFDSDYRNVAGCLYGWYDTFDRIPDKAGLVHACEDLLEHEDKGKANIYIELVSNIVDARDNTDGEFTLKRVQTFLKQQWLKTAILESAEHVNDGTDEGLVRAEEILRECMERESRVFDYGTRLTDYERSLRWLHQDKIESFSTGIPELDQRDIGPIRKGLQLFIALPKRGKSWWMCHLGKWALINRQKVLHITLEMSEESVSMRYCQSLLAISKHDKDAPYNLVQVREQLMADGFKDRYVQGLTKVVVKPKYVFTDEGLEDAIKDRFGEFGTRMDNLIIKEFPTGMLTMRELEGYIQSLISVGKFKPDLILVDYADLMRVEGTEYRHAIGRIYKELRGLAVKYNVAVATASQSNRAGGSRTTLDDTNVAEDFSKIAIADSVITYNQSETEHNLGLARLYVSNARHDEDKFHVLISQNYQIGQFCLDSKMMAKDYFKIVPIDPKKFNDIVFDNGDQKTSP